MTLQATRFNDGEASAGAEALVVQEEQGVVSEPNSIGILENFDIVPDVGTIFYGFDHTTGKFLKNKNTDAEEEFNELLVVFRNARAYFEKFDEETKERIQVAKQPVLADGQKDTSYKLKSDFVFSLSEDLPENPSLQDVMSAPECKLQLNPTSTISFKRFVKLLHTNQISINGIYIRLTGSKTLRSRDNFRYKKVEFEALDIKTKQPLGIKTY